MRNFIVVLFLALAGCNQGTNNVPYSDPALVAKVDALTKALADATHNQAEQAKKLSSIQLFVSQSSPMTADHALQVVDFGPCSDAGVKTGSTGKSGLDEQTQVFKQTHTVTCPGVYAEYDVLTGNLHITSRIYYTTTDCTGTSYEWDASGFGIDRQKLEAGVSFISPNTEGQMWVAPGTIPSTIQAGSVFTSDNGCQPDGDNVPMWLAVVTDTATSGVALSLGADYQLSGL